MKDTLTFIDLFSGCGGMSLGFEMAGYRGLLAIDFWQDALDTYAYNRSGARTLCADLSTLSPTDIQETYGITDVDVIIGGPPCQGFSIAGKRIVEDERNKLYKAFVNFVKAFRPKAFVMENVPNILNIGNGAVRECVLADFRELGYEVQYKVLTASDYGVPQNRKRAFFIGLASGIKFEFPEPFSSERINASEALCDLPEQTVADGTAYPCEPAGSYQIQSRKNSTGIYNHETTKHNDKTIEIIGLVPDGGNYKDLPEHLRDTRKVHIAWTRLNSKKPSFTIDCGHRHHFHYKYNRIPTVREAARIQSFPDSFIFLKSRTSQYKQVGNAVPPLLAKAIAARLGEFINYDSQCAPESKETLPDAGTPAIQDTDRSNIRDRKYYTIPGEYYHRIHFVRPRFKNNIENVLLYMATECSRIKTQSCEEYNKQYTRAIRMFPGNIGLAAKTLANWRTEIPALFGFYEEDRQTGVTRTSRLAFFLSDHQDLTQFFKFFLLTFQFPGGHLKAQENAELIKLGIRFKPARYILQVLMAGNELKAQNNKKDNGKAMSISAEEAAYCIFNDTRVTTGQTPPSDVASTILDNRKKKLKYYNPEDPLIFSSQGKPRNKADVTRYAGDILDYMVTASLLTEHHGYYQIRPNEFDAVHTFANDNSWFGAYDHLYGKTTIPTKDISDIEILWYRYVSDSLDSEKFKSNLSDMLQPGSEINIIFDNQIISLITSPDKTNKEIGSLGEALIFAHEKMRLKSDGLPELANKVRIVDSPAYHPGYDIESYEGLDSDVDGDPDLLRLIEVKTTISKQPIQFYNFHMSTHEWTVAKSHRQRYCVYRLMLSETSKTLIILRDPVGLDKADSISTVPRDGMDISFPPGHFPSTKLIAWKD